MGQIGDKPDATKVCGMRAAQPLGTNGILPADAAKSKIKSLRQAEQNLSSLRTSTHEISSFILSRSVT